MLEALESDAAKRWETEEETSEAPRLIGILHSTVPLETGVNFLAKGLNALRTMQTSNICTRNTQGASYFTLKYYVRIAFG